MKVLGKLFVLILLITYQSQLCFSVFQYSLPILKDKFKQLINKDPENLIATAIRVKQQQQQQTNKENQTRKLKKLLFEYLNSKRKINIVGKRSSRPDPTTMLEWSLPERISLYEITINKRNIL